MAATNDSHVAVLSQLIFHLFSSASAKVASSQSSVILGSIAAQLMTTDIEFHSQSGLYCDLYCKPKPKQNSGDWTYFERSLRTAAVSHNLAILESSLRLADNALKQAEKRTDTVAIQHNSLTKLWTKLKDREIRQSTPEPVAPRKLHRIPDDYPSRLNADIYKAVQTYSSCRCTDDSKESYHGHRTRLCLNTQTSINERYVLFKFCFNASPVTMGGSVGNWQQIGLLLPSKLESRRRVGFADVYTTREPPNMANQRVISSAQDFCNLLKQDLGPILFMMRVQDGVLVESDDVDHDSGQSLEHLESITLTEVLGRYQLTTKMRLVLAYIIALSVWRYYSSDWMKYKWTTDSIHFLREKALYADTKTSSTRIYAHSPCFAVQPQSTAHAIEEFCSGTVAFRYPRLLALGVLLIQLGCQNVLEPPAAAVENSDKVINADYVLSSNVLRQDPLWPHFDTTNSTIRDTYRAICSECLNRRLFTVQDTNRGGLPKSTHLGSRNGSVEERRNTIYRQIVSPLEELLEQAGCKDGLRSLDAMKEQVHIIQQNQPHDTHLGKQAHGFEKVKKTKSPSQLWIEQVQNGHFLLFKQHMGQILAPDYQRTRIAILDTGYDPEAVFFTTPLRKARLKGWKDFVSNSAEPMDEDGHGSRVVSLLMKVALVADVYVARVARNSKGLENCDTSIVNAISWAADECKADVISMSFGFSEEKFVDNRSAVRDAIYRVVRERNENILFFAAAGNDGANEQRVMFPARHELVIPVYGTDAAGAFSKSLNPRIKSDGPAIFATLAEQVPCSGLCHEGEVVSHGTSLATAIAAGMAGVLLEYATLLEKQQQQQQQQQTRPSDTYSTEWRASLAKRRGMIEMFKQIAENPPDRRYYLHPLHFFQKPQHARISKITLAVDESR